MAAEGNTRAIEWVDDVFETCDRPWRGFGVIRAGGFRLRERWARFDAVRRFEWNTLPIVESTECRGGDVLSGRIKPTQCEHFGQRCTPESPLGRADGLGRRSLRCVLQICDG